MRHIGTLPPDTFAYVKAHRHVAPKVMRWFRDKDTILWHEHPSDGGALINAKYWPNPPVYWEPLNGQYPQKKEG